VTPRRLRFAANGRSSAPPHTTRISTRRVDGRIVNRFSRGEPSSGATLLISAAIISYTSWDPRNDRRDAIRVL